MSPARPRWIPRAGLTTLDLIEGPSLRRAFFLRPRGLASPPVSKKKRKPPAWLQTPLYFAIRTGMALPLVMGTGPTLHAASAFGRRFATLKTNRKRLERAMDHLSIAFPDWPDDRRREYAVRAYQHLFTLGTELAFLPRLLNEDNWPRHVLIDEAGPALRLVLQNRPVIMITGHCGNWELVGYALALLGLRLHAVYRPLDLQPLDAWVRETRARRGMILVDKFGAVRTLPKVIAPDDGRSSSPVAFVADQNAGDRGVFVPYFGRLASTYKSIGLMAMQFDAVIICGSARRLGPHEPAPPGADPSIRYHLELADIITPEDYRAHEDPLFYLTARYRRAIEQMVRHAPEQYLWMHRMWKSRPRHERDNKPFPAALRAKLRSLPWMTEEELARIVDRSDRDRAYMAANNTSRL